MNQVSKFYYFVKHLIKNEITMAYFISTLKLILIISTFIVKIYQVKFVKLNYTNDCFKLKLTKNFKMIKNF